MKISTKIFALSLVIVTALCLSGCGNNPSAKTTSGSAEQLIDAILERNVPGVRAALKSGADANMRIDGTTPLHLAIYTSGQAIIEDNINDDIMGLKMLFMHPLIDVLVEAGGDINAKDNAGRTPLDIALAIPKTPYGHTRRGASDILDTLRSKGAKSSRGTEIELKPANELPKEVRETIDREWREGPEKYKFNNW